MPTINELHATRANKIKESRTYLEEAEKAGRWNQEDQNKWDAYQTEINSLKTDIDVMKAGAERKAQLEQLELEQRHREKEIANDPTGLRQQFAGTTIPLLQGTSGLDQPIPDADARSLATEAWFLGSRRSRKSRAQITDRHRQAAKQCGVNIKSEEFRFNLLPTQLHQQLRDNTRLAWNPIAQRYQALTSLTGAAGGVLVPEGFVNRFERAQLAYGGMLPVSEILTTTGANPMPWPMGNDTGNKGRRLNESAAVANDNAGTATSIAAPTFSAMTLYAYKYTSDEILIPYELLRDSAIDLPSLIAEMFAERLARVQNDDWTTGTGVNQPYGVVTKATTGKTTASATAITFDEALDLQTSVDPAYRGNSGAGFMANDAVFNYLRKLKTADAKYYWQQAVTAGEPDTLHGSPTYRNQSMASSIAASATTMLYGDFSKYKIRRVGRVRVIRMQERYRDNDQDAFLAFVESDGNLLNAGGNPVKALVQHS